MIKIFKPVAGIAKDVSIDVTKTMTETSKEGSIANWDLNEKVLKLMNKMYNSVLPSVSHKKPR